MLLNGSKCSGLQNPVVHMLVVAGDLARKFQFVFMSLRTDSSGYEWVSRCWKRSGLQKCNVQMLNYLLVAGNVALC